MKGLNIEKLIVILSEKMLYKEICSLSIRSNDQLANVLPKSLKRPQLEFIWFKLGTHNLYSPT